MKIVCTGMNYMPHNNEAGSALISGDEPLIYMKPDSSMLRNHKPFFLPDFMGQVNVEGQLVVRISRLGKSIAARFAGRYWDAVTFGAGFTAIDVRERMASRGLPWCMSGSFDASAIIGDWIDRDSVDNIQNLDLRLDIDSETVQTDNTRNMVYSVDRLIEYVSQYCTLKTGDLIFTGSMAGVRQVSIGQHLQGYVNGTNVLDFHVR